MFTRYAVYFSPSPASKLGEFGNSWLGWDINSAQTVERPQINGLPDGVEILTQTPQKYGFHGTIKAPFHLTENFDLEDLVHGVGVFADARHSFDIGQLQVSSLGGFLALTQRQDSEPLAQFASDAVVSLDKFRAPLSEKDIKRRLKANLSTRQEHLMRTWGYPYIMDEFRFHLTLTGRLEEADAAVAQQALSKHLGPVLNQPVMVEDICLCGQRPDERFEIIERFALRG